MSELLKHITKCRFCAKEFLAPALAIPIIGEPPHKNVQRYVEELAKHLATKHPPEWAGILGISSNFTGVLVLRQFETHDRALMQAENIARYSVHNLTRRNLPPTDEGLKANLQTHGFTEQRIQPDSLMSERAFDALKELRDYLIEAAFTSPVVLNNGIVGV